MAYQISRRAFVIGSGAALTTLRSMGAANAASGQIIVGNWGGDWNDRTVQFFEAPIVEQAGYTMVRDLGDTNQRRTKLIAGRRLPVAPMDVAHIDDATAFELAALDGLETVDQAGIPRLKEVVSGLATATFVPWQYSGWILGYNPSKVPEAPASFADLWNPKFKGMVGLSDVHWYHHIEMAALKVGKSFDTINIDAVKESLMELKSATNPRIYPNHLQQAQALKNEEILVATNYKARILQFAAEGANVATAYPSEGGIAIIYGFVIPKKAPNPEGAKFYCNALLDPVGQAGLALQSFYSPANSQAKLPDNALKRIAFGEAEQKSLHKRPHEFWIKNRNNLLDWWNKEFKR